MIESLTFILALFLFEFLWISSQKNGSFQNIPWFKLIFFITILILFSKIVLIFRYISVGLTFDQFVNIIKNLDSHGDTKFGWKVLSFENIVSGTWSYSLLSATSIIGDYIYSISHFSDNREIHRTKFFIYYGKDYLDLILSLPPGFVSDAVGYDRPWSALKSPAYDIRHSQGGWNYLVLPFRNFLTYGVFFISLVISFL